MRVITHKRRQHIIGCTALFLLLAGGSLHAATDGSLGERSTGKSSLTLSKLSNVRVSDIDDIHLGSHAYLDAPAVGSDRICVFSSNEIYQITFNQSGGTFALIGERTQDTIPYTVSFTGSGAPMSAAPGATIGGQSGDVSDPECHGTLNASYSVTVDSRDFNLAQRDTYSAVLELLIKPE